MDMLHFMHICIEFIGEHDPSTGVGFRPSQTPDCVAIWSRALCFYTLCIYVSLRVTLHSSMFFFQCHTLHSCVIQIKAFGVI